MALLGVSSWLLEKMEARYLRSRFGALRELRPYYGGYAAHRVCRCIHPEKEQYPLPCFGRVSDPSQKHRTRRIHGGCFGVSGTPPLKPSLLQNVQKEKFR